MTMQQANTFPFTPRSMRQSNYSKLVLVFFTIYTRNRVIVKSIQFFLSFYSLKINPTILNSLFHDIYFRSCVFL